MAKECHLSPAMRSNLKQECATISDAHYRIAGNIGRNYNNININLYGLLENEKKNVLLMIACYYI